MGARKVLYEREGAVGRIMLNRPDEANALDLDTTKELYDAAVAAAGDPAGEGGAVGGSGPHVLRRR